MSHRRNARRPCARPRRRRRCHAVAELRHGRRLRPVCARAKGDAQQRQNEKQGESREIMRALLTRRQPGRLSGPKASGSSSPSVTLLLYAGRGTEMDDDFGPANSRMRWRQPPQGAQSGGPSARTTISRICRRPKSPSRRSPRPRRRAPRDRPRSRHWRRHGPAILGTEAAPTGSRNRAHRHFRAPPPPLEEGVDVAHRGVTKGMPMALGGLALPTKPASSRTVRIYGTA